MNLLALFGLGLALVQAPAAPKEVKTSISCEALVPAPPAQVWRAFTTKEGLESWMVAQASFDLRIGGLMRTKYGTEGHLGDEGTIENVVLSYDPERMLSIQVSKAPANFPFKNAIKKMWTVLYFEPTADGQTKVRCVGHGFTPDEESQTMRGHFEAGNKWTVDKLAAHFKK